MADTVIVLDEEEKSPEPAPTHITQPPFAAAKKRSHVLLAENQELFQQFIQHCEPSTKDCPDVLVFLQTKHAKACPKYLSSVEFRNVLGRCLTRAQSNRLKTFVYINELCTVLRQHSLKKRHTLTSVKPADTAASTSTQPCSPLTSGATQASSSSAVLKVNGKIEEGEPCTSGHDDGTDNQPQDEKKSERRLKKQVAYLENLLKMYNEEICRLQQAELSLDDMSAEDSIYIQENKLKNKMMKIYQKLCELKGCSSGTGRVIEHKLSFNSTRFPEINKKIERFINSAQAKATPPDYQDILQQVTQANAKHQLCLSKANLEQIARDAFRETASQIQERRHLDLVYNFGCHLTDKYRAGEDPARSNAALERKLRSNREVSLNNLGDVINKYARLQDEQDDEELRKKQRNGKAETKPEKEKQASEEEEEDEEDESEDESEDADIEAELKASTEANGSDNEEEDGDTPDDRGGAGDDAGSGAGDLDPNPAAAIEAESLPTDGGTEDTSEGDATGGGEDSPLSEQSSPMLVDVAPTVAENNHTEPDLIMTVSADREETPGTPTNVRDKEPADLKAPVRNGVSSHSAPAGALDNGGEERSCDPLPRTRGRSLSRQKRKREESGDRKVKVDQNGDDSISLDMGVFICDSPARDDSTVACIGASTLSRTPGGVQLAKKKKMVDKWTQCDPEETIVLSDSEL
ncbi:death domain-associated protein 6 [Neosynchiropus ocellatus]